MKKKVNSIEKKLTDEQLKNKELLHESKSLRNKHESELSLVSKRKRNFQNY